VKQIIALLVIPLSGCFATVKTVDRPVPVPCIAERPVKPNFVTDDELKAMTDYQLTLALYRDRVQRLGYEAEIEAVLLGCLAP
jgi:hypothetical protein